MTYFAKGSKFRAIANSTREKLKDAGYKMIVWRNGDFEML